MSVPLRIAVDVGAFRVNRAGVARYLESMLEGMLAAAPDEEFFFYSPQPVDVPLGGGNWHLRHDCGLRGRPATLWVQNRLPRLLAQDKVDVFWGQNHMLPLRLSRPCARILTVHDLTPAVLPATMHFTTRLAGSYFLARAARAADCVVAVSKATASLLSRCYGVGEHKVRVIYEGPPRSLGSVSRRQAEDVVREHYGLAPGYLLTVGTIEPRKDHLALFAALRLCPDAPKLVVVGAEGWRCRSAVREMRHLESVGRAHYLGRVADGDLASLYAAASLAIYPSLYEGFGLPVLEAMACGCPVLCSRSSSLTEVGGGAACYFRTHDVQDLASKIGTLLSDPVRRARMVDMGRKQVAAFSFPRAATELMDLIRSLARRAIA